jgi:osmoprotectant transport system substrate-binding protein
VKPWVLLAVTLVREPARAEVLARREGVAALSIPQSPTGAGGALGIIPRVTLLDEGAIDIGVVSSTDGRLADEDSGRVLLEDDERMFAADNIFPVVSEEVVDAYGDDLIGYLDSISAELTTQDLIALNKRYDVDKDDAEDIATDWLDEHGFGG